MEHQFIIIFIKVKLIEPLGIYLFSLNSNKLHMAGVEWIYHYKEMHYKIFYNQIFDLENQQEKFLYIKTKVVMA